MKVIIRNAIRCKKCNDIIESKSVHDMVSCRCGCCLVDGGKQYIRRIFDKSPNDYEELSEFKEVEDKIQIDKIKKDSLSH